VLGQMMQETIQSAAKPHLGLDDLLFCRHVLPDNITEQHGMLRLPERGLSS
jgi:hypothetical protein